MRSRLIGILVLCGLVWQCQAPADKLSSVPGSGTSAVSSATKAAAVAPISVAPDAASFPPSELALYGQQLIAGTAAYFGPRGTIRKLTNGMNCQNCHLKAGTEFWGNNFGAVASTYPKYRERRGALESVRQRIADCFERSLNGQSPDSGSREMEAMVAYMQWVGTNVPKGKKPDGSGVEALPLLSRAADPVKGKALYSLRCQVCHGATGGGILAADSISYVYPPLWGGHSYNTGAGLYRLSRFAGFVKDNMPYGTDYRKTVLTDEEAWDLAAFVNSQPRPAKTFAGDYPNLAQKPFDQPFGPYADSFSQQQHKYGPFAAIQKAHQRK